MLNLVTDRTEADVANLTKKGIYTYEDLNRVTDAMEYLVNELQKYGYSAPGYKKGPFWLEQDIPTPQQMNEYLENIRVIRSVLELMQTTPTAPDSMDNLTYQKANDIEKILIAVEETIQRMISTFVPCGPAICGGDYL